MFACNRLSSAQKRTWGVKELPGIWDDSCLNLFKNIIVMKVFARWEKFCGPAFLKPYRDVQELWRLWNDLHLKTAWIILDGHDQPVINYFLFKCKCVVWDYTLIKKKQKYLSNIWCMSYNEHKRTAVSLRSLLNSVTRMYLFSSTLKIGTK